MRGIVVGLIILLFGLGITSASAIVNTAASPTNTQVTVSAPAQPASTTTVTQDQNEEAAPSAPGSDAEVVASSGRALVKLFVLAVILESALALLFNWRPFVVVFDGRGVKSIVSLAAALAVTFGFKPDAVATLLEAYGSTVAADNAWLARILEAMVIAGGSAAVNSLLVNLGFRSIVRAEEVQPKPAADEAWLSVALKRVEAVGPVQVEIAEGSDPAKASWRLAGTITGTGRRRRGAAFFLRDFSRFPNSGGRTLQPGQPYMVRLTGKSQNADPLESKPPWGPCTLASRAMIDIELKL